jgi:hypothetical protein
MSFLNENQTRFESLKSLLLRDGGSVAHWFVLAIGLAFTAVLSWLIYTTDPWVVGDWLINYHFGGFKRRGLAGTFVILAREYAGIPIRINIFCLIWTIYMAFLRQLYLLLKEKYLPIFAYFLFLTPLGLLFGINAVSALGRKDALILLLFIWLLRKRQILTQNMLAFSSFLLLWVTTILHYEVLIFYLPWFCYLLYQPKNERNSWYKIGALVAVTTLATGVLYAYGLCIYSPETNAYALASGLAPHVVTGILTWSDDFDASAYLKEHLSDFQWYIASLGICFLQYFLVHKTLGIYKSTYQIRVAYFLCVATSIPLFLNAVDWGRWLYLHYILLVLLTLSRTNYSESKITLQPKYLVLVLVWFVFHAIFISTPNTDLGIRFDSAFTAAWRFLMARLF